MPPPLDAFCSVRARADDVQLVGTAKAAPAWLVVEWPAPWPRKAVREAAVPPPLRAALARWQRAVPGGLRVQWIRREVGRYDAPGRTTAFLARPSLHAPRQWRARVADPAALAAADVPALLAAATGDAAADAPADPVFAPHDAPLVLTCTHGKRDRCCARWGRALHAAFADVAGGAAWQTTHLGGHRFAPTALLLPHGVHVGWLRAPEAAAAWTAYRAGRLPRLDRYRGHVGYAPPVQAADAFVRAATGLRALDALRLDAAASLPADEAAWRVTWRRTWRRPHTSVRHTVVRHTVVVAEVPAGRRVVDCAGKVKPLTRFVLRTGS